MGLNLVKYNIYSADIYAYVRVSISRKNLVYGRGEGR